MNIREVHVLSMEISKWVHTQLMGSVNCRVKVILMLCDYSESGCEVKETMRRVTRRIRETVGPMGQTCTFLFLLNSFSFFLEIAFLMYIPFSIHLTAS